MDFSRRMAQEKDLDKNASEGLKSVNAGTLDAKTLLQHIWLFALICPVFDESGNFILYPTMLGIKGKDTERMPDVWILLFDPLYCGV